MKSRIFFRTLRFIAFYWSLPFLVGSIFTMFILTWGQLDLLQDFDEQYGKALGKIIVEACK